MGYSGNEAFYLFSLSLVCPASNSFASVVDAITDKFLFLVFIFTDSDVGRMAGAGGYAKRFLSTEPVLQSDHAGGDSEHGVFVGIFIHTRNR